MAQGSPTLLLSLSKFLLFVLICLASIKSKRHQGRRLCVLLFPSYLPVHLLLSSTFVLRWRNTICFMLLTNTTFPHSHLSLFGNYFLDCLSLFLLLFFYSLLNPCFLYLTVSRQVFCIIVHVIQSCSFLLMPLSSVRT